MTSRQRSVKPTVVDAAVAAADAAVVADVGEEFQRRPVVLCLNIIRENCLNEEDLRWPGQTLMFAIKSPTQKCFIASLQKRQLLQNSSRCFHPYSDGHNRTICNLSLFTQLFAIIPSFTQLMYTKITQHTCKSVSSSEGAFKMRFVNN